MGLEKKDAMNRARWRVGVKEIAAGVNPATPVYGDKPDQNWIEDDDDDVVYCMMELKYAVAVARRTIYQVKSIWKGLCSSTKKEFS